ncbi:similar to Saccharomyces cerevisiae YKL192C ACP1 Mitochondrial matrix acyl carrier protein, involved in biosynthesis of octanoate, which is a precursor to lipoic acid [Maudiozyma saulgeensis]|uniref:Acyl carrier protein n=1 Tax=Maudiozyma saulgeensis TaxID=1789683 RepID=A0A1X7RAL7_9SACH|nr:similar to Saccharomyces cerevisiae YKL192C ACP1 Mitochondrial matrix acyl carrier protein, involved in biosynthesis of octanoate, which is a precursor to lipoic acid [Kazachstania saulgeensis]
MFRSVLRTNASLSFKRAIPMASRQYPTKFVMPTRLYSESTTKLTPETIQNRVSDVIKAFGNTNAGANITTETSFHKDLGLDSLDTVELLVAIEEEFDIEIPDKVADELKTVGETVKYISSNPESL